MSAALFLSMASFALASSITPGPVNALALASGVHYGFRRSLAHVTGATVAFTAVLLLAGFGLAEAIARAPALAALTRFAGVAFLLYMAWGLSRADGGLGSGPAARPPSVVTGAVLQGLNPKAWIAAIAGMGAFGTGGGTELIWSFAALYFVICFASIAVWAYAGARLAHALGTGGRLRLFNRVLAILLILSAVTMAIEG